MARLAALLTAALMLAAATPARAEGPKPAAPAAAARATATIPVKGMHCGGCAATVAGALRKVPGVREVQVSLEKEQAVVVYEKARTDEKKLVEAIRSSGYEAGTPAAD
jgi:copper chaperone CopZ